MAPFLELWYRYVVQVLTDSQSMSANPPSTVTDVKLAIQSKVSFRFSQPPPREVEILLELTAGRNKIPLPKSIAGPSVPLPPEQDTLLSPNYQLIILSKKPASTEPEETEDNEDMTNPAQQTSELRSRNSSKDLFPSL
ncbi:hypothetical protein HID58_070184 [Brassica napus]|uniref:Uncharacterized protein n=1 Tax=Brassica napus TaxID=3708 RepID=A0ABQ7YY17_BRANA|nr:hypothetical protein HID58_070184 [Brassica napus]